MKTILELFKSDTLEFSLYARRNPHAAGAARLAAFVTAFLEHARELAPDKVQGTKGRAAALSADAVAKAVAAQTSPAALLSLSRKREPELSYSVYFYSAPSVDLGCSVRASLPIDHFADPARGPARARDFVGFVRALAAATDAVYAFAHPRGDLSLGDDPHQTSPFAPKRVYEAYWLAIYGTEVAEAVERERMLSAPAHAVEALPGGGVLVLTSASPLDATSDAARVVQARTLAHLIPELREADVLAKLRARSAKLAPVERDWDPDIAASRASSWATARGSRSCVRTGT
jgi:hypothetical protein